MESFECILMSAIWFKVLTAINYTNLVLQARNATLDVEVTNIKRLIDELKTLRYKWDSFMVERNISRRYEAAYEIDESFNYLWKYNHYEEEEIRRRSKDFVNKYKDDVSMELIDELLHLKFIHDMSKSKKRSYLDKETISYPQCVICYKVLGNDSMKPSKLAIHLNKCHPDLQTKDTDFFKRKFESLKRCKLDKTGIIYQTQQNIVEASYKVSYIIAQNKKAHTLAEEVILPCTKEIVRLLFREEAAKKVDNISLSNTTVKRRLTDISSNIKENVINEIKESPYFSIQLDESTDFFNDNQLQWKYLFGITTEGAPAMMGCKSELQTRVKEIAPNVVGVHCFIHRQALATKTLPGSLKTVFNQLIKLVNYIKSSAFNTRLFTKFCSDLNAEHNKLLFYTSVRWLSAGNFLERFFMLRNEVKEFLC
nr:zinc finger BED domain-containing protein 5-like [Hydra vulgaris]